MKMRKLYVAAVLAGSIFLSSCNKDTDMFVAAPGQVTGPDPTWYQTITSTMPVNVLRNSLLLPPDQDSFQISGNADTIVSASGLQCIFPANSITDMNGLLVSGEIHVQSFLLKSRGTLISMALPTIVSSGNVLVSGGVFSVNLNNDTASLKLAANAHLNITYSDTGIASSPQLFNSDTVNGYIDWVLNQDVTNIVSASLSQYQITTNHLGPNFSGYFYDTTVAQTSVAAAGLPSDLTNANTIAYLVFNDMRSAISMQGDVSTHTFISNKVPVGKNVTVVTISKDGNFYYLGQQTITTVAGPLNTITVTPVRCSLSQIKSYLNNL